jgi:hypothetical protein
MDFSLFVQEPLALLLKIKKIEKTIHRDDVNEVLFAGLNDCSTQLELFCTQAMAAQSEREVVEAIRHAYQKVASTRYYIEMLSRTGYIPKSESEDLSAYCDHIESRLQPLIELNNGKYDDMTDEEFFEALQEIFDQYLYDEDDYG